MSEHEHVVQTSDEGTSFCIVCELESRLREAEDNAAQAYALYEACCDDRDRLWEATRKQLSMMTDPAALPYLREALEGTSDE